MNKSFYIDVHTHQSSAEISDIFRVMNLFAGEMSDGIETNTKYSVGLHPWHIETGKNEKKLQEIEIALQNPMVIAIGETGLDKGTKVPMELQKEVFLQHLKLAEKYARPLIIHAVRSFFEIIEVYKKSGAHIPLIFHGFNGRQETAKQLLKHEVYFSFGKDLVLKKNRAIESFKCLPSERLFLETDDSNYSIKNIYEKAAFLRQMSVEDLKEQIYENYVKVFKEL
jgi:TatD DNase family protein